MVYHQHYTLFATLGIAVALLSTPIYKADALIQIERSSGGISAMVGDMGELFSAESSATTEIEIIKSRMILGDTVDKFNLTTIATLITYLLLVKVYESTVLKTTFL